MTPLRMIIDPSDVSGETGWVCAFIACGQPTNKPHVPECPYTTNEEVER